MEDDEWNHPRECQSITHKEPALVNHPKFERLEFYIWAKHYITRFENLKEGDVCQSPQRMLTDSMSDYKHSKTRVEMVPTNVMIGISSIIKTDSWRENPTKRPRWIGYDLQALGTQTYTHIPLTRLGH